MRVRPGDVVLYRDGAALEAVIGTVHDTPTPRTLELCCGTWIARASVVRVIRHVGPMPTHSTIATAMKQGTVHGMRPEDARPRGPLTPVRRPSYGSQRAQA